MNDYGLHLDPDEKIINTFHRSVFDVLPTLLLAVLLWLAAVGLAFLLGRFPDNTPFPPQLMVILIVTMMIIAAVIFLVALNVYRGNVLIFTNEHLFQVERLALFQRRVSQLSFKRVEDVTGRRVGFLQSTFNYGDVQVQSAGEQEKFIFKNISNPEYVADLALQIHEECLRKAGLPEPV